LFRSFRQINIDHPHFSEGEAEQQHRYQYNHQVHEGGDVDIGFILLRAFYAECHQAACCIFGAPASMARFSVITFRNLMLAISMLSMMSRVFLVITALAISSGIAAIRPKAVVFMAMEIDCDNSADFSAGSALATAAKAAISDRKSVV